MFGWAAKNVRVGGWGRCVGVAAAVERVQSPDRWQWQPDLDKGYSVRSAYNHLTAQDSVTLHAADSLIWHSQVLLKVSIFVWRLLRDRAVESAQHLFLSCTTFGSIWSLGASLFYATHLARKRLSCVERQLQTI
ncbi:hypothetical protein TSUD_207510 [Trifolium subterraneum]|uniref:Reverse transcriptase zinc-binding domain-containing protein n=1 Tax=Trifolium subterraneum TaxID=3900 RepID=A0A2Z6NMC7_TRISU|nr:hypothetical protein TSUD_207510 [Trifolium subterraneum]